MIKQLSRPVRKLLFLSALAIIFSTGCERPPEITELQLINNPNERVPLAGILSFMSDKPVVPVLTIDNGKKSWTVAPDENPQLSHAIPVLGLKAGTLHRVMLSVVDGNGETMPVDTLEITTPPLPDDFPPVTLTTSEKEMLEPGITMLNLFRWNDMFDDDPDWGLLAGGRADVDRRLRLLLHL